MKSITEGVTVVEHPLVRVKLTRLRDERTDPGEFRALLAELALLLTIEATCELATLPCKVRTPLDDYEGVALARPMVIVPILRAGLGMVEGMLRVLSNASVGHIGMRRDEKTHRPTSYYFNMPPDYAQADIIVVDPMLATGHSASEAIAKLKEGGAKSIRFLCVVSCPEGLAQIRGAHADVPVFTAAVDERLNEKAYIVPGLGDAGDRCFGTV